MAQVFQKRFVLTLRGGPRVIEGKPCFRVA